MKRPVKTQSGFAAMAAMFLLVVLAAMGAFMLTFSNTQQLTATQDVQGTRAYWAARAGLEWAFSAITQDIAAHNPIACPTPLPTSVNTGASFTLTVSCTLRSYTEGSTTVNIFFIDSLAKSGTVGSLGYVERSVSASYEVPQ
jgi:MSHA biogenesis protein MshP